ncbi:hypothetical protein V5F41_08240 [Xanthobacter autotrophicus]|uniref:hypothetical protein n=1 Tax=Xanthobacter autotrophicus TaxID=280 RepID=UPI00372C591C
MTETDDIVARLNEKALDLLEHRHATAGWLMQQAASRITRLEERCAALTGQVEAGAAEIERVKVEAGALRMCLNCGRTADAATVKRGADLPECRGPDGLSGCTFDATPQEAWVFWSRKAHDYMIRAEAAERERDDALANLTVVFRKTGCTLFLDGRNEHGSHVIMAYPTTMPESAQDDINEYAEEILAAAEALGFIVGEDQVWTEWDWIDPQIGDEGRVELRGYWDFVRIDDKLTRTALKNQEPKP